MQIDKKKDEDAGKKDKELESLLSKDPSEIKIGFQKIKSSITLEGQPAAKQSEEAAAVAAVQQEVEVQPIKDAESEFIKEANARFGIDFFKDFSLSDEHLMQISLEEHIRDMKYKEDVPLFVASMISNAYELNSWIPNVHMMLYRMFCMPKTTEKLRKEADGNDLLVGNIFNNHLSITGYKSLLHSVLLTGKKKHFKKILTHMVKHLPAEQINDDVVQKTIEIAVCHEFPILLGKTMHQFVSKGVKISKENYVNFYMYLDRCKGLEKDTLRFIFDVNNSEHIQMDWDFVRPFFSRAVNFKTGLDVLEKFEQIKPKLVLNKKNLTLPKEEQDVLLNKIKSDFYRNLINMLLDKKGFAAADIIYTEYRKQMKDDDPSGLIGMKICTMKKNIEEFEVFFNSCLQNTANTQSEENK